MEKNSHSVCIAPSAIPASFADLVVLLTFECALDKLAAVALLSKLHVDTSDFDDSSRLQVELALSQPAPPPPPPLPPSPPRELPPPPPREPPIDVTVDITPNDPFPSALSSTGIEAKVAVNGKLPAAAAASAEDAPPKAPPVVTPAMATRDRVLKALQAERLISVETAKARAAKAKGSTNIKTKVGTAVTTGTPRSKSAKRAAEASAKPGSSPPRRASPGANSKSLLKDPGVSGKAKAVPGTRGGDGDGDGDGSGGGGGGSDGEQANTRSKSTRKAPPHPQVAVAETSKSKASPKPPPSADANAKGSSSAARATPTDETSAAIPSAAGATAAAAEGADVAAVAGNKGRRVVGVFPGRRTPSPVPTPRGVSSTGASNDAGAAPSTSAAFAVPKPASEPRNLSPTRRGAHSPTRQGAQLYGGAMRGSSSSSSSSSGVGGGGGLAVERALPPLKAAGKRLVVLMPSGPPDPTVRPWPYRFRGDYFQLLQRDPLMGGALMCDPSKNASYVGVMPPMEVVLAGLREEQPLLQQLELEAAASEAAVTPAVAADSPPFAAADSPHTAASYYPPPSVSADLPTPVSTADAAFITAAAVAVAAAPIPTPAIVVGGHGVDVSASKPFDSREAGAAESGGGSAGPEALAPFGEEAAATATSAEDIQKSAPASTGVVADVALGGIIASALGARELVARDQPVVGVPPAAAAVASLTAATSPSLGASGSRDLVSTGTAAVGGGASPLLEAVKGFAQELAISGAESGPPGGVGSSVMGLRGVQIREAEEELKALREVKIPRFVVYGLSLVDIVVGVGVAVVAVVNIGSDSGCWSSVLA